MGELRRQRFCKECGRKTLHTREASIGTGMGCLLTVITAGLWIPVWLLFWLYDSVRPLRCNACGGTKLG